MARTTTELATEVLRELSVLGATETADAADVTYIAAIYNDKFEEWTDRDMTYWDPTGIPNPIFIIIRDLIVNEVRGAYGEPVAPEAKDQREELILKRLRRHLHKRSSDLPVKAETY